MAGRQGFCTRRGIAKALEHLIETGDYKTIASNCRIENGIIEKPIINGATS